MFLLFFSGGGGAGAGGFRTLCPPSGSGNERVGQNLPLHARSSLALHVHIMSADGVNFS